MTRVIRYQKMSFGKKILGLTILMSFLFVAGGSLALIERSYDIRSSASGVPLAVVADITAYPVRVGPQEGNKPQSAKSFLNSIICLVLYPVIQLDSCKQ